jgi:pimeloyl-ACP methyl ester carboxylesterase
MDRHCDVPVAGGHISVSESGSGPAVLLLHGGPGLSDYTFTLVPELADGYRVVRFQQRGLAPSTTDGPFTVERHVADALAAMDMLDIERACVVGSSWGGHLAMHLVVSHEERFAGLVPVDPLGAIGDGGEADLGRLLGERVPEELAAQAAEIDELAMAGEGTAEDALKGLSLVWPAYFAKPDAAPPMSITGISLECYARTWDSIHDHLARHTLEERLPSVQIPTVFVLGAQSPIPPEHGQASAALIPGARCQIEEGCGHFVWLERPGAVRAAVDAVHAEA